MTHELDCLVEFDGLPDATPCVCGSCGVRRAYAELDPVEGCVLTPGDPSPAGRCPDEGCGALCYPDRPEDRMADAAPAMLAALRAAEPLLEAELMQRQDAGEDIAEYIDPWRAALATVRAAIAAAEAAQED